MLQQLLASLRKLSPPESARDNVRSLVKPEIIISWAVLVLLGVLLLVLPGKSWQELQIYTRTASLKSNISLNVSGPSPGLEEASNKKHDIEEEEETQPYDDALRNFIYVYPLPDEITSQVAQPVPPFEETYVLRYLQGYAEYTTADPHKALLFYLPILPQWFMTELDERRRRAGASASPELRAAVLHETSRYVEAAIAFARGAGPFYDRFNGSDHFAPFLHDSGRCVALEEASLARVGDLFAIQLTGDRHATWLNGRMPCYRPELDIIVPPSVMAGVLPIVAPDAHPRPVLFSGRFHPTQGAAGEDWFGHHFRTELFHMFEEGRHAGWDFNTTDRNETNAVMQRSIFCACPPGYAQWTRRWTQAITNGCIPVTMMRHNTMPFEDQVDHSNFSVNVDPDDFEKLPAILASLAKNTTIISSMQRNLQAVQSMVSEEGEMEGMNRYLMRELQRRARVFKMKRGL